MRKRWMLLCRRRQWQVSRTIISGSYGRVCHADIIYSGVLFVRSVLQAWNPFA